MTECRDGNGKKIKMMYFEKAIENYAKARKEFYAQLLKEDIADFNQKIEQMIADGKCHGFACADCPVMLMKEDCQTKPCYAMTLDERREVIAMEVAEK